MPIDSGLFGFVLNLVVFTALIDLAASLEVLPVLLKFSKQIQLPPFTNFCNIHLLKRIKMSKYKE